MPSRARLFTVRVLAGVLFVAAIAVLLLLRTEPIGPTAPHTAGFAWPSLIAAALLAGSACLATPTVLFSIRRRRFRRILASER